MTFKTLLLAATMAGGLAFGASAANAQIEQYTITGPDSAYTGSFEFNLDSLPISTSSNIFYSAFDGTGNYAGINEISLSPLEGTFTLFDSSNNLSYTVDSSSIAATGKLDIVGSSDVISAAAVSAAPEPGVWVLLIAGVAMVGSLLRFSNKQQGALSVA